MEDCHELAETMRQEDRDEIWHLARVTPMDALLGGLEGHYCKTVLLDGAVVAMFGVSGIGKDGDGIPWMLASDLLKKIRKPFLRESKEYLDEMFHGYKRLYNVAWQKNKEHLRWLKWLGFKTLPFEPMGPDGELYCTFYKVI